MKDTRLGRTGKEGLVGRGRSGMLFKMTGLRVDLYYIYCVVICITDIVTRMDMYFCIMLGFGFYFLSDSHTSGCITVLFSVCVGLCKVKRCSLIVLKSCFSWVCVPGKP